MPRTRRTYALTAAVAAIVTAANASQGAYFSQSWGWVALAFLVPTTVLLILDRVGAPGRLRTVFAALVVALAFWIALSSLWSISSAASLREFERMLVYVAVALALALVVRRGDGAALLAGAALGVTLVSAYALATRLFPDRLDTYDDPTLSYRLAQPLGYWNSLGLLAAIGILVALGVAAHARRASSSLAGAAVLPVLATTLYFTFSRGAWAALAIGLIGAIATDPRRLRLIWVSLVVSMPCAVTVAYASRHHALTTEDAPLAAATREGHRVAGFVVAAAIASMVAALAARAVSRRVPVTLRVRRVFDMALAGGAVIGIVVALVVAGGPSAAADRFEESFGGHVTTVDLNDRLFTVAGNGRTSQYRVAWTAGRDSPLVGQGSGTFEYLWYERRPNLLTVRDGHSLYLETYAELGLVGLSLLAGVILVLLVGGVTARRTRFVASGTAAFIAWAAASAFDWHWEMVGVTLTALLAGGAGLVASERGASRGLGLRARRPLLAAGVLLSVSAVWSLVGNQALFAARDAVAREDWSAADEHGRRARALLFWSFEPDVVLGDAAAGSGDRLGALHDYRDAVSADPNNWVTWLRLAQVARGSERAAAYDRVRQLNPREEGLPGE
jgi:O-antigen ligase